MACSRREEAVTYRPVMQETRSVIFAVVVVVVVAVGAGIIHESMRVRRVWVAVSRSLSADNHRHRCFVPPAGTNIGARRVHRQVLA